jgi:hypothetical protein
MSDYEAPAAYKEVTRKALKEHRCCECQGRIYHHEQYRYLSGVWDRRGVGFKYCLDCYALMQDWMRERGRDEYAPLGGLMSYIFEGERLSYMQRALAITERREGRVYEWRQKKMQRILASIMETPILHS